MRDDDDNLASIAEASNGLGSLLLEELIARGQGLVDEEDLRFDEYEAGER